MFPLKVNTTRKDQTIHHAVLDGAQLKALVLDAVAKAAGLTVDRRTVRVDQLYLSSNMGSTGTEYRATCTIIVDHQAQAVEPSAMPPTAPTPSIAPPAPRVAPLRPPAGEGEV